MERYAITHLGADGLRVLTFANQGRNHYDTKEAAQHALNEFVRDGSLRAKVLGDMAGTLEVRPVDCYEHGDAKGIYFPTNMQLVTGPSLGTICIQCGLDIEMGRPAGDGREAYADLEGTAFKAYYCVKCATPALELQHVSAKVRP